MPADRPHLDAAAAAEGAGDLEAAEVHYRAAVDAGEARAELYLGELLVDLGRPLDALPVLEAGIARGDEECQTVLGLAREDLGEVDEALAAFRAGAQFGDADAWHHLGRLLRWLGRLDEAVAAWRISHEAGTTWPDVFASLLADVGAYDEAVEILEAEGDAEAILHVGEIEQERGRLPDAEAALRRAFAMEAPDAAVFLANVLKLQDRPEEAREVLEAGAEQGFASAELQLANDLSDDDVHDPRVGPLYRSAYDHGELDAEYNLGAHLLDLGQVDEALVLIQRAAERGDELARRALAELS